MKSKGDKPKLIPFALSGLALLTGPEKRRASALVVFMILGGVIDLFSMTSALPFIAVVIDPNKIHTQHTLSRLYALAGTPSAPHFMIFLGAAVIALLGIGTLCRWTVNYMLGRYVASVQHRLAGDLLRELVAAPYSWFLTQNYTSLSRLVYEDIVVWARSLIQRTLTMANDVITTVLALGLVLTLSPRTGLLALVVMGTLTSFCFATMRPILLRWAGKKRHALDKAMLAVSQAMAGIRDIKLSSRGDYFTSQFSDAFETASIAHAEQSIWHATPSLVMIMLGQMTLVGIAMCFVWKGDSGALIATQLALLLIVTSKAVPAVNSLSVSMGDLLNAYHCVEGIKDLRMGLEAATRTSKQASGAGASIPATWKQLTLKDIGFRYPAATTPALHGISLQIKRNRSYGVVGRSAAGKSTLLDIVVGLLEAHEGQVSIDDAPLSRFSLREWQNQIGYVAQTPFVVHDTLRANIAFGVPADQIDDARVIECLRLANLDSVRAQTPLGLDMPLGERGTRLSGGQRQRIAIARALYHRPNILVLDEATSALDAITESEILETLETLKGKITLIVIAHRLSTIRPCDSIFVLEKGALIGQGSYSELEANHALFQKMVSNLSTRTEELHA